MLARLSNHVSWAATMATRGQQGNARLRLFQSLLWRLAAVSRTRCGILHAAPQSRDRTKLCAPLRPRLCSAPLRKGHSASKTRVNALMALRCVRGTDLLSETAVTAKIRRATPDDADFIAWTILAAQR